MYSIDLMLEFKLAYQSIKKSDMRSHDIDICFYKKSGRYLRFKL